MDILAKFKVTHITDFGLQKEVNMQPVIGDSEENKSFSKYTPSGNLSMRIDKETQASEAFEVGKNYYLKFSPAE